MQLADDKSRFKEENFDKMAANFPEPLQKKSPTAGTEIVKYDGKKQAPSTEKELRRLIDVLKARELYPFIVFSFSRRECEAYAQYISSPKKKKGQTQDIFDPVDLNNADEKDAVRCIFDAALQCLEEEDRKLPCVESMLPMLLRGVGVHHSGLLPILKEIVELLFQENLVKCLFSTETFAMGLNMPAKTVVFTSLTKWDGEVTRPLSSGEYIQMSGRAGRRGKDDRGFSMMLVDSKLTKEDCKEMLKGEASPLQSSFRLSYYTLLNLIRSRSLGRKDDMEYVISKSFQQFQHEQLKPALMAEAEELRRKADSLIGENRGLEEYVQARKEAKEARKLISQSVVQPDICLHVLRPGRIIRINALDVDWGYGVLLCVQRLEEGAPSDPKSYIVDVMLSCKLDAGHTVPCSIEDKEASMLVLPVALTFIMEISTLRISLPESLKTTKNKNSVRNTLKSLIKKYPLKLPELDPINDLGLSGKQADLVVNALANEDKALEILRSLEANGKDGKKTPQQLNEAAEMQYTARKKELETSTSPINKFEEEFKQRKDILRKLGHIDMEDTVTLKARVLVSIA